MSKTYRPYEPDQLLLMPPSLTDWLPAGHMIYFVREILDTIDLSPISSVYEREERGNPPYHPNSSKFSNCAKKPAWLKEYFQIDSIILVWCQMTITSIFKNGCWNANERQALRK